MSFLWEGVKQMSQMAGAAALLAGQKTKLRGEIMLVEREMKTRQQTFGVELYDFVAPLAKSPDFFAANDQMTDVIRGPFLAAQREIAALMIKRSKLKEELAQAEVARKAAFPAPATTFGEQVLNTGKATAFTANEVKIKTEIGMVDAQIRSHKEEFGEQMFDTLVKLEDEQGWLPTVRDIRTMYDKARQDVDKLKTKVDTKEREFATLGTEGDVAAANFSTTANGGSGVTTGYGGTSSNSMGSGSAHSRPSPLGPQLVVSPAPVSAPVPALSTGVGVGGGDMFGSSPTFASPAPVVPPAASSSYADPFGSSSSTPAMGSPPSTSSGLFLGMAGGDASSAMNAAASAMGGASYGIRKAQPKSSASAPQMPTNAFSDPFSSLSGGSHHSHGSSGSHSNVVDPFASTPTMAAADPFGGGGIGFAAAPQHLPSTGGAPAMMAPNDPFAFTTSQPNSMAQPTQALPYDPFKSSAGARQTDNDDPFADLVASGQR